MLFKKSHLVTSAATLMLILTTACSAAAKLAGDQAHGAGSPAAAPQPSVALSLNLESANAAGTTASAALLGASVSYDLEVGGCLSGLTTRVTGGSFILSTVTTILLPVGDTGCTFKFHALTIAGVAYTFPDAGGWQLGNTYAGVTSAGVHREFYVRKALDSPITTAQTIDVRFADATDGGATTTTLPTQTVSLNIQAEDPFPMSLRSITPTLNTPTAGYYGFAASMACTTTPASGLCAGLAITGFRYNMLYTSDTHPDPADCQTLTADASGGKAVTATSGNGLVTVAMVPGKLTGQAKDQVGKAFTLIVTAPDGTCFFEQVTAQGSGTATGTAGT